MSTRKLPKHQLLLYSAPTLPISMVGMPMAFVLPAFYEANTTATLAAIGAFSFATRAFDAVTDPMIGLLSDRTKTPIGRRKPWLIGGSVIAALALFRLFTPEPTDGVSHYAIWSFIFFLGFTLIDVPQRAWGIELAESYDERSRISTYIMSFTVMGTFLFWLGMLAQEPFTGTTELNSTVFRWAGWAFVIMLPAFVISAVLWVPQGRDLTTDIPSFSGMLASFRGNRPLWRFVAAMAIWQTGNGIFAAVMFIFISRYMLLSAEFPYLLLTYSAVMLASLPVWLKLMYKFGKHRCWSVSWALNATVPFLILLIEPGPGAFWPAMALITVVGFIGAGFQVVPMALLGDVVDYDILKTGVNRAGNYYALYTLLFKFSNGAGLGIGLPLLAAFGYSSVVPIEGMVKAGLFLTYFGLPLVFGLTAAALVWNFPIDARRHAIIRRRIEQRAERAARDALDQDAEVTARTTT